MSQNPDVIILGAGAAGLSAAIELTRAGLAVSVIEARNRIGGRIFTLRDPVCDAPIELGAEFIHGKPPEIWDLLRRNHLDATEVMATSGAFAKTSSAPATSFPKSTNCWNK